MPALPAYGSQLLAAAPAVLAAVVWFASLQAVDIRNVSDVGVVSALPAACFAALAILIASFTASMRRPTPSTPVVLVHLLALIRMLHGVTAVIGSVPSFNVVWRHAGVTDFIATTGTVDPDIDAYFNWPGFFFLSALATKAAGLDSSLHLSPWAPVAFELLYLPAMVVITRAFTDDRRLAWTATWIFYMTNWVGQDYFSPQAMAYVLYLGVMAVLLTYLARARRPSDRPPPDAEPAQRAGLMIACVVVSAAATASHQLTPWMMLAGVSALVLTRRCTARGLPAMMVLLLVAWMTYLAAGYLNGHLKLLLIQAADFQGTVNANVGGHLEGSAEHLLIVRLRLGMTAVLWGIAFAGYVRARLAGTGRPAHALLAIVPLGFVALQPYGGEMLLRAYLFGLPFMACFAARALVAPQPRRWGWRTVALVGIASALLTGSFLFTRYGNERVNLFTAAEVQAVDRLYRVAPRGSVLVAASPNLPWKARHYADYTYRFVEHYLTPDTATMPPSRRADALARGLTDEHAVAAYLIVTRSQRLYDAVLGSQTWGTAVALQQAVERSRHFRKVFDDGHGAIFQLVPMRSGHDR